MEYNISTSINKINSFPILPPIITNDITTEIQYYKQLAIAVGERLKALEVANQVVLNNNKEEGSNCVTIVEKDENNRTNLNFEAANDKSLQEMTSIDKMIIDYPTNDIPEENLIDISTPVNEKAKRNSLINKDNIIFESKQKNIEQIDKTVSDDDTSCLNETLLCNSISSDTVTASTDLNQYFNTSTSMKTDTSDTTPEKCKPQVPKTLDIVPITVDTLKSDKLALNNGESLKLVRSGSYILDTPSPMLLAHIQNESINTETKTPLSSFQKSSKCKELSSNFSKVNCENQSKVKESNSSRLNCIGKIKKGHSSIPCQRVCRSVSNSKTCSPMDVYQPTNSVECIQSMFKKEFYSPKSANNKTIVQTKAYASPVNGTNHVRNHGFKKSNKNASIINLANRLSGSLGSLSSVSPKNCKRVERKNSNDSNLDKSFISDYTKSNDYPKKEKPAITSEKIITIFKEIHDTQKRQMVDLIKRQQKEQVIMQEDFKKQQILLLAQIRKAFPEMSILALSEAISGKSAESNRATDSKTEIKKDEPVSTGKIIEKAQINGITESRKKDEIVITKTEATNNSTQSKEIFMTSNNVDQSADSTVNPSYQNAYQLTQSINDTSYIVSSRIQLSNITAIDDIPVGNPIRRHSNVSRQLFPLDKANRFPQLDNSKYTDRHIKAATIINAYAKGFLVRRLMRTEKIIALKNTYKEALLCMLRLYVDEPLQIPEIRFKERLQQQCDAASMNIVDLFSQDPALRMEIIAHDREIKIVRSDRPSSARSYSFATQRTLARKKLKEMGIHASLQGSLMSRSCPVRTRCQTWTSNTKERKTTISLINQGIKRSTSAGAVRKPWR